MRSPLGEAFVGIANVSKRFGATAAVDGISLDVARGEFFSLLGPSGCGKTTLLRMIGGFIFPDTGRIVIDGEDVTGRPPNRRPTNMVFQSYAIFPHLNVHDNIAYGLRSEGLSPAEREARVMAALAMISLEGFAKRRVQELSGGERQRVALARALVKRPKVLLLDEPLGALDKRLRERMQIELRQLQRNIGITFIFVTHDQEEALSLSDRVAVMEKGRFLQVATPKVLYEEPASREVAEFVGTMNFFDGRIIGTTGDSVIVESRVFGRLIKRLPVDARGGFALGQRVLIAARPENLALHEAAPDMPSGPARVLAVTYLGDRTLIELAMEATHAPVMVSVPNAASDATRAPGMNTGTRLHVSCRASAMVILPA